MAEAARRSRVERLLEAAQQLQNPEQEPGRTLRQRLRQTSGLSPAGIELGLRQSLETSASPEGLTALLESTPEVQRAHVLLSANVFVAPLRAIALGLAAAERVVVRASRRDPALAEALHALTPELFELSPVLEPEPGDRYFAYGSDETLAELRAQLPRGVWFHAHGTGLGAVVLDAEAPNLVAVARGVALDVALFDQRGCLSPRVVCVTGSAEAAPMLAAALAEALAQLEREAPPGPLSEAERAQARRERDAAAYAFELLQAGSGWVSRSETLAVPPARRCLHVVSSSDPVQTLAPLARHLTCLGVSADPELACELARAFPGARQCAPGQMQRPPLDGPVDRRAAARGELL